MSFKHFLTSNWRFVNSNNFFNNRCAKSILETQSIGYAQRSVDENLLLSSKPKRPTPPFFQFLQERRQEVVEKHNLKHTDAVRVVSEMWKNFDANTKEKMAEIYHNELEKYKEDIKLYNDNLTEDQKNEIFRKKYEVLENKTKRKAKKELKELGKPRKPPSAYILYVSEEIKKRGDVPVQNYMPIIASNWNKMDSNSRAKYYETATKENDKYLTELDKWENEMINAGRFDLVRPRAIKNDDN